MAVNQDLKIIIEKIKVEHNLTQAEIASRLGRNSTYLSGVINGHIPLAVKLRDALYEQFQVFIELEEDNNTNIHLIDTESKFKTAIELGIKMLPEVDFRFSAGNVALVNNTDAITRYWYLPDCEDCEAVAPMTGTSMLPMIPPGCSLVMKRYSFDVTKPNTIAFGNVFGIVVEDPFTRDWHGHIKILRRHKDPELAKQYWIAHSTNTAEFDDFDIEIAQVRGLWIVKQHVVMNVML